MKGTITITSSAEDRHQLMLNMRTALLELAAGDLADRPHQVSATAFDTFIGVVIEGEPTAAEVSLAMTRALNVANKVGSLCDDPKEHTDLGPQSVPTYGPPMNKCGLCEKTWPGGAEHPGTCWPREILNTYLSADGGVPNALLCPCGDTKAISFNNPTRLDALLLEQHASHLLSRHAWLKFILETGHPPRWERVAMDRMARSDGRDYSVLTCACHASFEWEGISDKLAPWLTEHAFHMLDEDERIAVRTHLNRQKDPVIIRRTVR